MQTWTQYITVTFVIFAEKCICGRKLLNFLLSSQNRCVSENRWQTEKMRIHGKMCSKHISIDNLVFIDVCRKCFGVMATCSDLYHCTKPMTVTDVLIQRGKH